MSTLTIPRNNNRPLPSKASAGGANFGGFVVSLREAMSFERKVVSDEGVDPYPETLFLEDIARAHEPLKGLAESARAELRAMKAAQKAANP